LGTEPVCNKQKERVTETQDPMGRKPAPHVLHLPFVCREALAKE